MSATTLDGEARLLEGGEGSRRESVGEGGNGQKDGGTKEQGFPIRSKTASNTSPSFYSRTNERPVEKRSTEQERDRTWTDITNSHGSCEQQYQQPSRGSTQGTGTTGRVSATHVGPAITDAASSSTASMCSDGSHSTARRNATSNSNMDIRRDAAKDLVRMVRDGSTPEGQRLWVWLHLQDEEATEPVPRQLQSWLTGQRTQQRKEFKRNRRRHSSQTDLIEIFSASHVVPHAVRQGLRTTTPTNLDVTENWDATTVTGRNRLEDILEQQKPWMTILKPPCTPFLDMFGYHWRMTTIMTNDSVVTRWWPMPSVLIDVHQTTVSQLLEADTPEELRSTINDFVRY